jgi:hypothetical protein
MTNVLDKAFQMYLQGYSLRNLTKRFNIPKSTLSVRFKKNYGVNYTQLRNSNGVLPIIKEYMFDVDLLSYKDRAKVKRWYNENIDKIMLSDLNNRSNTLLTDRQLNRLTLQECGHRTKDWGDIISDTFSTI